MAKYNFARKTDLNEKQKNVNAKRTETAMSGYYYDMEKHPPKNNMQAKHKPYQCDIKLK